MSKLDDAIEHHVNRIYAKIIEFYGLERAQELEPYLIASIQIDYAKKAVQGKIAHELNEI